jgi:predicted Zn finger-like uncharacterized protein
LTQCPSCSTLFRVTASILKMGHGQVRCGKCRTQFDALESIQDEEASNVAAEESSTSTQSEVIETTNETQSGVAPAKVAPEPMPRADEDMDFDDAVEIELSADGELEQIEDTMIVVEGRQESIDADEFASLGNSLDDSVADASDDASDSEVIDLSQFAEADAAITPSENDDSDHYGSVSDDQDAASLQSDAFNTSTEAPSRRKRRNWLRRSLASNSDDHFIAAELAALTVHKPRPASRTRLWAIASVALVLTWLVQIVHHHRDDLVRNAGMGSVVTRVYHALGLTLTPRWDLAAYELQQWGIVSDPKAPDTLRVRASVTNRAQFSQPYPLIRLELQDRWGAPVAMRVFDTEDYLPEKSNANRLLAPKQRANAEIVIADPGADAVGFQIHACLRYQQELSCSDG